MWTATNADGTRKADAGDCADWTSADAAASGWTGESDDLVDEWTLYADIACSSKARLYCFEQRP